MNGIMYAAIAYVRNPVGAFVEELRRELHPSHTHSDAHLTILPPRPIAGTEQEAIRVMSEACREAMPFDVTMGDVETFVPTTPTIFLRVAHGAYRMRELHDLIDRGALKYKEPWPYMPHLTIVKMDTLDEARNMLSVARKRWDRFEGSSKIRIDTLAFVKGNGDRWVDLAVVPIGPNRPW